VEKSGSNLTVAERTVLDRLLQAGISQERALRHLRDGGVLVDGRVVTDPASAAALSSRVELRFIRGFDSDSV